MQISNTIVISVQYFGSNEMVKATTILSVRRGDKVAIGGDGQVTLGDTVIKGDAVKIRKLADDMTYQRNQSGKNVLRIFKELQL